jgi:hypothetical protein
MIIKFKKFIGGNDVPKNAPLTLMEKKGLCPQNSQKFNKFMFLFHAKKLFFSLYYNGNGATKIHNSQNQIDNKQAGDF